MDKINLVRQMYQEVQVMLDWVGQVGQKLRWERRERKVRKVGGVSLVYWDGVQVWEGRQEGPGGVGR